VNGISTVEPTPKSRHQEIVQNLLDSIYCRLGEASNCDCVSIADARIRFPDGSRKRADIALFRGGGDESGEIITCPQVVIEVLQSEFIAKDLVIGVPFYQRVRIPDIIVFDPEANVVRHWRNGGNEKSYTSPVTLDLLCGCTITI
jgi:Uma2 family endonuclease